MDKGQVEGSARDDEDLLTFTRFSDGCKSDQIYLQPRKKSSKKVIGNVLLNLRAILIYGCYGCGA